MDTGPSDLGIHPDAACSNYVTMYDTHAQALYLDGTHGPLTGIIHVSYVVANQTIELEFWHGHGGRNHTFTLGPSHFSDLKQGRRVTVETSEVDRHRHSLFIDPTDARYRVMGASPVQVPVC